MEAKCISFGSFHIHRRARATLATGSMGQNTIATGSMGQRRNIMGLSSRKLLPWNSTSRNNNICHNRRKIMGLYSRIIIKWDSISYESNIFFDTYNDIAYNLRKMMGIYPRVFVDKYTRIILQGYPDKNGTDTDFSDRTVGVVTSEKGVTEYSDLPIFNTVEEAKAEVKANASVIYASPRFAASAILEAIEAELDLVVCITKGIPQHEMVHVQAALKKQTKTRLIGPNSPGIINTRECTIGILPPYECQTGCVGIVARSETLMLKGICETSYVGLGQSTCVGIGGDPFCGTNFVDCLKRFEADPQTKGILLMGEIEGTAEDDAAAFIKESGIQKPVVSWIAGLTAPDGAIISGGEATIQDKIKILREAGVTVVESQRMIGETIFEVFKQRGLVTQKDLKYKEYIDSQFEEQVCSKEPWRVW